MHIKQLFRYVTNSKTASLMSAVLKYNRLLICPAASIMQLRFIFYIQNKSSINININLLMINKLISLIKKAII